MKERIERIKEEFQRSIASANTAEEIEALRIKYLGRKGEIAGITRSLPTLPKKEIPAMGRALNVLKNDIQGALEGKKKHLGKAGKRKEKIDITLEGVKRDLGSIHPITKTLDRINEIFMFLGFKIVRGPEIETEFNNFEALNIPLEHPSRDAFDTFYLEGDVLLRSHTSTVQIRIMKKQKPPVQAIMPGRVYRPDAVDASHSFMFHQVEGLMVDEGIKFSDLKGVLNIFAKQMFGENVRLRFRPSFFPFTEPSAEVDLSCIICNGKGCRVCSNTGWLEILGAGMVNPLVFKKVGYNPKKYTGFAFGMGVERIAMLKYGISDIRLFYENDLRFLKQF
jgi:phenylalanyl-tRNA synthetase alpha chain